MPRPAKYDVSFSEKIEVKLTAEQKELIKLAFENGYSIGTATMARELLLNTAGTILKLEAGEITPEEAAQAYTAFVARIVDSKELFTVTPVSVTPADVTPVEKKEDDERG
jgi:hypothetical protein